MDAASGAIARFAGLVTEHYGLAVGEREVRLLTELLPRRARAKGLQEHAYLAHLEAEPDGPEWGLVADGLVVGESYFFRDTGQFELLRRWVLPDLIARGTPRLRLWSAGCACGEEPYSLAMLWLESFAGRAAQSLVLDGTDASPAAVAAARRARYRPWAFRQLQPERVRRWFQPEGDEWQLSEQVRRMVDFRVHNLNRDAYPEGCDLILCRNLFIYLSDEARRRILPRLAGALGEGGYLLTGHNELTGLELGRLVPRLLPEGLAYRRSGPAGRPPPSSSVDLRLTRPPRPAGRRQAPTAPPASSPLLRRSTPGPRGKSPPQPRWNPAKLADAGRLDDAANALRRKLEKDATDPFGHFLLGYLEAEAGRGDEARRHFRRSLYLDPGFVPAYVEIAAIYDRKGDRPAGRRVRRAALEVLSRLPEERVIEPYEGVTAGALAAWLRHEGAG